MRNICDVGSSHPGGEEAPKGSAVRRLKWHASWVNGNEPRLNQLITMKPELFLGNLRVTIKQWLISWEVVQFSWIDPVTTDSLRRRNRRYPRFGK